MSSVFADIPGQVRVTGYLENALESGATTHAYLIAGNDTETGSAIALRFAAGIIAGSDEQQFLQCLRDAHPDLHVLKPEGASGYLIEQVRELVRDAGLAPIRSTRKVYIVQDAQRLSGAPANAFLKTLEEPPTDVVCILVATAEQAVLETLRSRCEVLLLNDVEAREEGNYELFSMLDTLAHGCDNRTLLAEAARLVEMTVGTGGPKAKAADDESEQDREFLSAAARRDLKKHREREVQQKQRSSLREMLRLAKGWLRDCLVAQQGAPDLTAYTDYTGQTMAVGTSTTAAHILEAIEAVETCESRLSYNVTPQLAVEAMFIEIREALCRQ